MRHAQIERLRTLKESIAKAWRSHNEGATSAEAVLGEVEELVDILLMEVEDHDTAGSEP